MQKVHRLTFWLKGRSQGTGWYLRVQTPQGFDRATLDLAYQNPEVVATDDAGLMDALGIVVLTVAGDERSLKITTMADVQHALSLLEATSE